MTAALLWSWLANLLAGLSRKAAAENLRLPFALETFYRLGRRLRQGLDPVRTRLCGQQAPPVSGQADPMLQTLAHLLAVFPGAACPPADFQLHFQHPFLG